MGLLDEIDPRTWSTDAVVTDGGVVHLRTLRHGDGPALLAFNERISAESLRMRFMSAWKPETLEELEPFLDLDYRYRLAIVAELEGEIVAVGRYMGEDGSDTAEIAFLVEDRHHLRGIGTLLLEYLAAMARANGITRFQATTLGENNKMLRVFSGAGYRVSRSLDHGVWDIEFALDDSARDAVEDRELHAEAASIARFLRPGSVAVVGASNRVGSIGHAIFHNLLRARFEGVLYPVNPSSTSVAGVRAYASLSDIPDPVDLAIVAIPSKHVRAVIEEAGAKGVGGAVVITAGFAEVGEDGAEEQAELVRIAHRHGMRLVGPNCMGLLNTAADVALNATFATTQPLPGPVGFASQSGALGIAILATARDVGVGLSSFVSLGNKADVSGNDLLQYWELDEATEVAMLYVESLGNPRKFSRLARRFSRTKPLVVVKAGRTAVAQRAAASHTAAMASDDALADVLFAQAGIIRVNTLEELFDMARLLVSQPLPKGNRVAIYGNSGGPGILAADACAAAGLAVPELSEETQRRLREVLPQGAAVINPVDVIAHATAKHFEDGLRILLEDDGIDSVLVIFTDPMITDPDEVVAGIERVVRNGPDKTIAATLLAMGARQTIPVTAPDGRDRSVPVYQFPEAPAIALGRMADHAAWRDRPTGTTPELGDLDLADARVCAAEVLARAPQGDWARPEELERLLRSVGVEMVPSVEVSSAEEATAVALELAGRFSGRLALKLVSEQIQHKSDVGGVRLHLAPEEVAAAYDEMKQSIGSQMQGAVIQPMIDAGPEVIVGLLNDRSFGPVVLFGLGGTATELFSDRAFRLVPLTDRDAREMVREPRSAALLQGFRGAPPSDLGALEELVLRISTLADGVPEVSELDLNPVIARPDGVFIVDGRARIAAPAPQSLRELRQLDSPRKR